LPERQKLMAHALERGTPLTADELRGAGAQRAAAGGEDMTPEQAEAHGTPVALLRPCPSASLSSYCGPLPARERAAILAQAVHEGTMTRAGTDQVLIALALDVNGRSPP